MSLCAFRDVFGKPREGAHSLRLFDIAVVDLLLTVAASYWISRAAKVPFAAALAAALIISVLAHRAFCVRTPLTLLFFPKMPR